MSAELRDDEVLVHVSDTGVGIAAADIPLGFRIARVPLLNRIGEELLPRALIEASVREVYGDPARVSTALVDRYFELTLREGNRAALAPAGRDRRGRKPRRCRASAWRSGTRA